MNRRTMVIGAVLILIGLPPLLALIEAASFSVANRNNGTIISSGEKREYLLYVPHSYDRSKPAALVISMHGAGGWPAQQMNLSEWNPDLSKLDSEKETPGSCSLGLAKDRKQQGGTGVGRILQLFSADVGALSAG
jgi:hypothetical protein